MSRLTEVTRTALSTEDQEIWDRVNAGKTGTGGPYAMLMHSPQMAQHFAATEDYFRFRSQLPDADREVIILTAAREVGARYAWTRHEIRAGKAGITPATLEAIRAHANLDKFTGREKLLVEFTRTVLREHALSDDLFNRLRDELGQVRLVEAVGLLCHYIAIGTVLNVFDVEAPAGSKTF